MTFIETDAGWINLNTVSRIVERHETTGGITSIIRDLAGDEVARIAGPIGREHLYPIIPVLQASYYVIKIYDLGGGLECEVVPILAFCVNEYGEMTPITTDGLLSGEIRGAIMEPSGRVYDCIEGSFPNITEFCAKLGMKPPEGYSNARPH